MKLNRVLRAATAIGTTFCVAGAWRPGAHPRTERHTRKHRCIRHVPKRELLRGRTSGAALAYGGAGPD